MSYSPYTIISRGTTIRGETRSRDELIVEGVVEGNAFGEKIIIKEGGRILGNVHCRSLVIEPGGILDGDIKAEGLPVRRRKRKGAGAEGALPPTTETPAET